ncbi:Hypothetical protein D9617_5g070830 [Elsinoe fawcettii]|nr:Hypothetical protein D9617_5g070830 [Elsinoe fawcettii]
MADVEDPTANKDKPTLRQYFEETVSEAWTDILLILSCFTTGLLDGAVFNVWSCFVSMQTGNTVYVGLGFSGQPKDQPFRWAKSGTAILSFVLGSFLYSRAMRYLGPLKRTTIILAFLVGALLCFISALLVQLGVVPPDAGRTVPDNNIVLLPLCLLSISAAGQIVVSRFLGYSELTTVVLTSAYCDLAYDEKLLTAPLTKNSKRNRRAASMIMTCVGAIAGGFLTYGGDIAPAIWLAGGLKVLIGFALCFWKSKAPIRLE